MLPVCFGFDFRSAGGILVQKVYYPGRRVAHFSLNDNSQNKKQIFKLGVPHLSRCSKEPGLSEVEWVGPRSKNKSFLVVLKAVIVVGLTSLKAREPVLSGVE
jgi:hypothetical protein